MIEEIKKILKKNNYLIYAEYAIPYGYRIKTKNETITIWEHKNKYIVQGRNSCLKLLELLKEAKI